MYSSTPFKAKSFIALSILSMLMGSLLLSTLTEAALPPATLWLSLSASAADQTVVPGTENVELVRFDIRNSNTDTVTVSEIKMNVYLDDNGDSVYGLGNDNGWAANQVVSRLWLADETGTMISTFTEGIPSRGIVRFSLNWSLAPGSTQALVVMGDTDSSFASGDTDAIAVDWNRSRNNVVATDSSGASVASRGILPMNGLSSPQVITTITEGEEEDVIISFGGPSAQTIATGENEVTMIELIACSYGDVTIESMIFRLDGSNLIDNDNATPNFTDIKLWNSEEGSELTSSPQSVDINGDDFSQSFDFTDPISISGGDCEYISLTLDVSDSGLVDGDTISVTLEEGIAIWSETNATYLSTADITPSVEISGNTMTVVTTSALNSITVEASDDPVLDSVAVADADSSSDPLLVARYKIYATGEAFIVDELTFENDPTNILVDNDGVSSVIIKYPTSTSTPSTLDGSSSVALTSGEAHFSGLGIAVPESETNENAIEIEVYVVTNAIDSGGVVPSGFQIEMDFDHNEGFSATGQTTGEVITETDVGGDYTTTVDIDANQIALYKALPTFAIHSSSSVCPSSTIVAASESAVYCFSVSATGSGTVQLYKMTFDATPNLLDTGSSTGQLANTNGWKLYNYSSSGTVSATAVGSGTWSSSSNQTTINFDTSSTDGKITTGSTKYYVLKAPISLTANVDTSTLATRIVTETATSHAAMTAAASVSGLNIWSDASATSHSTSTNDWTNSYKLETLPTDYLLLSES